jgi:hypothetical protein
MENLHTLTCKYLIKVVGLVHSEQQENIFDFSGVNFDL